MNLDKLVDRFLSWPLPQSVCSDGCVTDRDYPHQRIGTNLLTADEAKQMLAYVLTDTDALRAAPPRSDSTDAAPQEVPGVNSARTSERTTLQPGGKNPEGPLDIGDGPHQPAVAAPTTKPGGEAVRSALIDLVRLKDLKEWIEHGLPGVDETTKAEAKARYEHEKEPAWEAARLALEATPPPPSAPADVVNLRAVELLREARCPHCDGQGWYIVPNRNTGEPEQEQCRWCDERAAFLATLPAGAAGEEKL